jgi:lysophospholipase L1-like esterase
MPGTAGRSGSIWPSFVDALGRPVVIANLAISGSAIDEWTTRASVARIRETLGQLRTAGYPNPVIIWMQGETDGGRRTTADTYFRQLETLMTVAPSVPWLLTRESICYDNQRKWQPLDDARNRLRAIHPNVTIGPDLDRIPLALRQADRCHLTTAGQDRLARELAQAVGPLLP